MIWVAFWWRFGGIIGGKLSKYSTIEKGGILVANLGTGIANYVCLKKNKLKYVQKFYYDYPLLQSHLIPFKIQLCDAIRPFFSMLHTCMSFI
jgi:hypothetical protein